MGYVCSSHISSRTYQNLKREGRGVLHTTDDVMLLACAAINVWQQEPRFTEVSGIQGQGAG